MQQLFSFNTGLRANAQLEDWEEDGLKFTDLINQPYQNCVFSAGAVQGHETDTVYLRWERDDGTGGMIMLRPDELAAIAHLATGVMWSVLIAQLP